jgi:hypothetical protein
VALGADRILIGRGLQVVVSEGAVRIVAVRTFHEAFIHPVMEGHIEGRLDVCVALEAKGRLFGLEQDRLGSSFMHSVAANAANVGLGVRRAEEVGVSSCVATQAHCIHLFSSGCSRIENLSLVTTRLDMNFARTMAALAGDALATVLQRKFGVWIRVKFFRLICVAGCAGLRAYVVCRING